MSDNIDLDRIQKPSRKAAGPSEAIREACLSILEQWYDNGQPVARLIARDIRAVVIPEGARVDMENIELRRQLAVARKALEPFAELAARYTKPEFDSHGIKYAADAYFTIAQIRAAHQALAAIDAPMKGA